MKISLGEGDLDGQFTKALVDVAPDLAWHRPVIVHVEPNAQSKDKGAVGMIDEQYVGPWVFQDLWVILHNFQQRFLYQIDVRPIGHPNFDIAAHPFILVTPIGHLLTDKF